MKHTPAKETYTWQQAEDIAAREADKESALDRYYREMRERQVGENKPDYDPWTGSYY